MAEVDPEPGGDVYWSRDSILPRPGGGSWRQGACEEEGEGREGERQPWEVGSGVGKLRRGLGLGGGSLSEAEGAGLGGGA